MGAFILFLAGIGAFVVMWLKKVAGQTAALDAAEKAVEAAKARVEEAKADVVVAEQHAADVQESVSARLARLDEEDTAARERDSVDVANEIIRRN